MVCTRCGSETPNDSKYCSICGIAVPPLPPPVPEPTVLQNTSVIQSMRGRMRPIRTSEALLVEFAAWLPLLNVALLLMWSTAKNENLNRARLARAKLLSIFIIMSAAAATLGVLALLVHTGYLEGSPFPVLLWP